MSRRLAIGFALLAIASAVMSLWVVRSVDGSGAHSTTGARSTALEALRAPWKPTGDTIERCPAAGLDCIAQAWSNQAFEGSASVVLARLERASRADRQLAASCHQVTHRIGAAAFTRLEGDVGGAIIEGAATCQGGYYHGVMQELVRVDQRPLREVVADACTLRPGTSGGVRNDCLHGLGHGVTIHLGWDLPQALRACDALGGPDRLACTGGVFMETFTPSVDDLTTRWNREAGPNWPCSELPSDDRSECHYAVGLLHMRATRGDLDAFARRCGEVVAEGRERCAEALGANAAASTQRDVTRIVAACAAVAAHRDACTLGASRATASWRGRPEDAAALCARVSATQLPACWEGIGNIARMVSTSETSALARCGAIARTASMPDEALGWCRDGRVGGTAARDGHATR